MIQVMGIAINKSVVRSCSWYLVLTLLSGWIALAVTHSASLAQDDMGRPGFTNDNFNMGPDGRTIGQDGRTLGLDGRPLDLRKHQESFLNWMIRASGIFGFLILLVAFATISIIMSIAVKLRRDNYLPSAFIEEFEQQLQAKDYQGAYEAAKLNDSFIGRILTAGMGRLSRGYEEAIEQMQQVGEDETMSMDHKIGYLALIGSIAPMLGLLGTVQGMVLSFQVIANSPTSPKPSELADGIATALFTTLEGLVVAIPAIIFYSLYKNRLARFLMECGFVAENLMKNFQGMPNASVTTSRPAASVTTGS